MRILLFLATNLAVLMLISVIFNLLGLEGVLANNGVDLNLISLLILSLLLCKFMAKRRSGTQLIEAPRNRVEQWLFDTVKSLADDAGIGMPEVGIFPSDAAKAFATGWNRNNALLNA